jgi:hypothetical protein
MALLPSVIAVSYKKKLLYFHVVDLYVRVHLYYFYLQYCIFLNFLFRYNTLFTYTSKNILLIIGIQCIAWAWWTLASFRISGDSVVSDKQRQLLFTTSRRLRTFWQQTSPTEIRLNQIRCGKSNKIQLCRLHWGGCEREGNLWFNFKFEIFYSGSEVSVAHSKITVAPLFSVILPWLLRNLVWPPERPYGTRWEPLA